MENAAAACRNFGSSYQLFPVDEKNSHCPEPPRSTHSAIAQSINIARITLGTDVSHSSSRLIETLLTLTTREHSITGMYLSGFLNVP